MKKILLIFLISLFFAGNTNAQKIDDYQKHYIVSVNMASFFSSSAYYITKKPLVSALIGSAASFLVGISKEYIYDGYLKRGTKSMKDLDGDGRGSFTGAFFSFGFTDTIDRKKQQLDTLKFQNLNKIQL